MYFIINIVIAELFNLLTIKKIYFKAVNKVFGLISGPPQYVM